MGDQPLVDDQLPTAVFIDYESLFFNFYNNSHGKPDLKEIVGDLKTMGKIMSIKVFGDFTKPELTHERNRVRTITNFIIDCGNESTLIKKDFTDFIMLDHIYQEAFQNQMATQFILITGDGHFSSVATFLKTYMDKEVGVYCTRPNLSRHLRDCVSWARAIEIYDDDKQEYIRKIASSLRRTEQNGKIATFMKTCEHIAQYDNVDFDNCKSIMRELISDGYISTEIITSFSDREIQRLVPNWEMLNQLLKKSSPA
ncbi:MAG: NYN domain-containing protein [Oscillospiraceae bacterium]|jgi:hypothetical protein|nr:NYN domain-containing protein [Oscillospiraceae bacterium]